MVAGAAITLGIGRHGTGKRGTVRALGDVLRNPEGPEGKAQK